MTVSKTTNPVIEANLAAVESHFHNENPETIDVAIDGYTDDIVWEVPARGLVLRDKEEVKQEYLKIFDSMQTHGITQLYRFATEQYVCDDSIFDFTIVGDGFRNCPFPVGTRAVLRIVHIFECRDGKICRENAYEVWRRHGDVTVADDIHEHAVTEHFTA